MEDLPPGLGRTTGQGGGHGLTEPDVRLVPGTPAHRLAQPSHVLLLGDDGGERVLGGERLEVELDAAAQVAQRGAVLRL